MLDYTQRNSVKDSKITNNVRFTESNLKKKQLRHQHLYDDKRCIRTFPMWIFKNILEELILSCCNLDFFWCSQPICVSMTTWRGTTKQQHLAADAVTGRAPLVVRHRSEVEKASGGALLVWAGSISVCSATAKTWSSMGKKCFLVKTEIETWWSCLSVVVAQLT